MRNVAILALGLLILTSLSWGEAPAGLTGEYIEARSTSVYAGPCHYSGEFVTSGREATLVWHIQQGTWADQSLSGLTVVAVISADDNLALDEARRKSVLYLDARATPEQRRGLQQVFSTKKAELLGEVIQTKVVPIQFTKQDLDYRVQVGELLTLSAQSYPCEHCTEFPYQVWYRPFESVETPVVGKATFYEFKDRVLSKTWKQMVETNSVFVGSFEL